MRVIQQNDRVWMWLQDSEVYKAMYRHRDRTFLVFNSQDDIILKYTGITDELLQELEVLFKRMGAKQLDNRREPFIYL